MAPTSSLDAKAGWNNSKRNVRMGRFVRGVGDSAPLPELFGFRGVRVLCPWELDKTQETARSEACDEDRAEELGKRSIISAMAARLVVTCVRFR